MVVVTDANHENISFLVLEEGPLRLEEDFRFVILALLAL